MKVELLQSVIVCHVLSGWESGVTESDLSYKMERFPTSYLECPFVREVTKDTYMIWLGPNNALLTACEQHVNLSSDIFLH